MPGPPDKVVAAGDLSSYTTPAQVATAMSNAEQQFFNTFGVWPNQIVIYGNQLYLGAY